MNEIPIDVRARIIGASLEGMSQRAICKLFGVSKNTVIRYREKAALLCLCGREQGHKGWCQSLVQGSIARSHFLDYSWRRQSFSCATPRKLFSYNKGQYFWSVVVRLSYWRFVDRDEFMTLVLRLARKYCTQYPKLPQRVANTVSGYWRNKNVIGMRNGRFVRDVWELGLSESGESPVFCWIAQRQHCMICERYAFVESTLSSGILCGSEWCERLHDYYYVQRKSRPLTVSGVKQRELRFNYLLSDFIRRSA